MPLVKKAPGIMTREVKLEEPVNELLEDYARFIESNADHVINAVLKKVLWRDQDYRKWREARRTAQLGPDKTQSEHGWACARRALARGDDPEVVIQRIADYRADDKDDPNYYARHTVEKAHAELQLRTALGRPAENNSVPTNEISQEK